jgi:hypothetical protein
MRSKRCRLSVRFPNWHEREQPSNKPTLQSDSRRSNCQAGSARGTNRSQRHTVIAAGLLATAADLDRILQAGAVAGQFGTRSCSPTRREQIPFIVPR